jgi:hypothetical protein
VVESGHGEKSPEGREQRFKSNFLPTREGLDPLSLPVRSWLVNASTLAADDAAGRATSTNPRTGVPVPRSNFAGARTPHDGARPAPAVALPSTRAMRHQPEVAASDMRFDMLEDSRLRSPPHLDAAPCGEYSIKP